MPKSERDHFAKEVVDALLIAETTIDQAWLELQTGHLPARAKEALDSLIRDYQPVTEQRLSQLALRPDVILVK